MMRRQCARIAAIRPVTEHCRQFRCDVRRIIVRMYNTPCAGTHHRAAEQVMFKMFRQHQHRTPTVQHAQRGTDIAVAYAEAASGDCAAKIEQLRRKLQTFSAEAFSECRSAPQYMYQDPRTAGGQRLQCPLCMGIIRMQVGKHRFAGALRPDRRSRAGR